MALRASDLGPGEGTGTFVAIDNSLLLALEFLLPFTFWPQRDLMQVKPELADNWCFTNWLSFGGKKKVKDIYFLWSVVNLALKGCSTQAKALQGKKWIACACSVSCKPALPSPRRHGMWKGWGLSPDTYDMVETRYIHVKSSVSSSVSMSNKDVPGETESQMQRKNLCLPRGKSGRGNGRKGNIRRLGLTHTHYSI